ncbi:hypothetical protein [Mucilaginibacter limnophilus]|uniref:hypothetical protein n=1 Tax=Mucilaginibacter limnophilus TaxID=1932778 RepID=UPI0013E32C82|nr:hypothetical protein [Mucilaginibacter limnophilus]
MTHNFTVSNIVNLPTSVTFELTSPTYNGLTIPLTSPYPQQRLPQGYTATVHLFKNAFHLQSEIIDVRIDGLAANAGKVGYFFRLDALFDAGTLDLNQHTYCYAYFALEYIFSNNSLLQTKDVEINSGAYKITDFFDNDTMILVLCDQYCAGIPNFNIDNYLGNLFHSGFVVFGKENLIEITNTHSYLEDQYLKIKPVVRPDGVYVLRLKEANAVLSGESFVTHLFKRLVQKKNDPVARFLMLYQVVEIYMSKIFPYEISNKVCSQLNNLNSFRLKEILNDMQKQKSLIQSLFNVYAQPSHILEQAVKTEILEFFVHTNHPDYTDLIKNSLMTLTELFYDLRNKLVHEYRLLHAIGVNHQITIKKLESINQLTEALMSEVVTEFHI